MRLVKVGHCDREAGSRESINKGCPIKPAGRYRRKSLCWHAGDFLINLQLATIVNTSKYHVNSEYTKYSLSYSFTNYLLSVMIFLYNVFNNLIY